MRVDVVAMAEQFITERRVEFCETDAAGIVHFASFLVYMEQAEHSFLRFLGLSVSQDIGDGWHLSWPRVHVECDYQGSARFEDILQVAVSVDRIGEKSVTYRFVFVRGDSPIATGRTTAVCCKVRAGSPLQSIPVPAVFADQLKAFCA
jgi:4-hydroxybenzoyl-CoA thioesterase/acyl-CoA thioester hydrolase